MSNLELAPKLGQPLPILFAEFLVRNKENGKNFSIKEFGRMTLYYQGLRVERAYEPYPAMLGSEYFVAIDNDPILYCHEAHYLFGKGIEGRSDQSVTWLIDSGKPFLDLAWYYRKKEWRDTVLGDGILKLGFADRIDPTNKKVIGFNQSNFNKPYLGIGGVDPVWRSPLTTLPSEGEFKRIGFGSNLIRNKYSEGIIWEDQDSSFEENILVPSRIDKKWLKIFKGFYNLEPLLKDSQMPWLRWFEEIGFEYERHSLSQSSDKIEVE